MRTLTAIFGLLAVGCGSSNPWDTSADQEDLRRLDHDSAEKKLSKYSPPPRHEEVGFRSADLEGWRQTVLDNADHPTLVRMHGETLVRIGRIEERQRDLATMDRFVTRLERDQLRYQMDLEKTRLKMIEDRQAVTSRD